MVKRRKGQSLAAKRGKLPGEYLKQSLVRVPHTILSADPERTVDGFRPAEDKWIVETRRLDGQFTTVLETGGVITTLPHQVAMKVRDHINAIMAAQKSDAARNRVVRQAGQGVRQ